MWVRHCLFHSLPMYPYRSGGIIKRKGPPPSNSAFFKWHQMRLLYLLESLFHPLHTAWDVSWEETEQFQWLEYSVSLCVPLCTSSVRQCLFHHHSELCMTWKLFCRYQLVSPHRKFFLSIAFIQLCFSQSHDHCYCWDHRQSIITCSGHDGLLWKPPESLPISSWKAIPQRSIRKVRPVPNWMRYKWVESGNLKKRPFKYSTIAASVIQ